MNQIAVISGKGGTGKSSISAAFASLGTNVVVADCDVDVANLYLLFDPSVEEEHVYVAGHKAVIDYTRCTTCGLCTGYCRFDAISEKDGRIVINEISCDGCFLCSRICPEKAISMVPNDKSRYYSGSFRNGKMVYGRLAPGEENSGKLVNLVRELAGKTAEECGSDTIILDGPPGIGCPVISTITGVDQVLIVTEPTMSGLSDLGRAADIALRFGLTPSVIVNKSDLNTDMTEEIVKWCGEKNITVQGILPFDRKVVEAMVMGRTITEYEPESRVSIEIKKIWNNIFKVKSHE